ncbi:MAG: branched-chain amino acid ABC transporter permease [Candidatus Dormibacteraeota bacterium]|nr:branched-chain amino acid ABC transporter permease [Candidatus Dormibacteraeota bacterium]
MGTVRAELRRRRGLAVVVLVLLLLPLIPPFDGENLRRWLVIGALLAGFAIAFDFTAGYINVVNFGFAAFAGAGGYASALITIHYGIPIWLSMLAGVLLAGFLGFATGVLTLRFRGIYAAVAAWFLGLALLGITRNLSGITRGPLGLNVPTFFSSDSNLPYYYLVAAMMVLTYLVLRGVTDSRAGLAFRAIGQNMDAARASGVNPTRYRILNFTLSCMFAGWLGAFYAHYYGILTPEVMATSQTVQVLVAAYLGGRGSLWGPAAAAFPLVFSTEWLRSNLDQFPGLDLVVYGIVLILVMVYYPGGLAELIHSARGRAIALRPVRRRP